MSFADELKLMVRYKEAISEVGQTEEIAKEAKQTLVCEILINTFKRAIQEKIGEQDKCWQDLTMTLDYKEENEYITLEFEPVSEKLAFSRKVHVRGYLKEATLMSDGSITISNRCFGLLGQQEREFYLGSLDAIVTQLIDLMRKVVINSE